MNETVAPALSWPLADVIVAVRVTGEPATGVVGDAVTLVTVLYTEAPKGLAPAMESVGLAFWT